MLNALKKMLEDGVSTEAFYMAKAVLVETMYELDKIFEDVVESDGKMYLLTNDTTLKTAEPCSFDAIFNAETRSKYLDDPEA